MAMHLGTTIGLVGSVIITAVAGLKARNEGWDVMDAMQSKWTGYNFGNENWDIKRPTATYCLVTGAVATKAAKWTGYNQDTPTGVNV
ncbi:unnamed protein product [marine sediment metagenome]|uniref:Uncharacterized protein n=1 Tax=marine sediment metagenome TaxID=412755 RepID=X1CPB4_9ZZZZ